MVPNLATLTPTPAFSLIFTQYSACVVLVSGNMNKRGELTASKQRASLDSTRIHGEATYLTVSLAKVAGRPYGFL